MLSSASDTASNSASTTRGIIPERWCQDVKYKLSKSRNRHRKEEFIEREDLRREKGKNLSGRRKINQQKEGRETKYVKK